jgi:hypothetical protein
MRKIPFLALQNIIIIIIIILITDLVKDGKVPLLALKSIIIIIIIIIIITDLVEDEEVPLLALEGRRVLHGQLVRGDHHVERVRLGPPLTEVLPRLTHIKETRERVSECDAVEAKEDNWFLAEAYLMKPLSGVTIFMITTRELTTMTTITSTQTSDS